jgi:hypothetical protein
LFWSEKRIPRWLRYGAGLVLRALLHRSQGCGRRRSALGARDGVSRTSSRRAGSASSTRCSPFHLALDDIDGSVKLIHEAGALVAYMLDGGDKKVAEAHAAFREALKSEGDTSKQVDALQEGALAERARDRALSPSPDAEDRSRGLAGARERCPRSVALATNAGARGFRSWREFRSRTVQLSRGIARGRGSSRARSVRRVQRQVETEALAAHRPRASATACSAGCGREGASMSARARPRARGRRSRCERACARGESRARRSRGSRASEPCSTTSQSRRRLVPRAQE